MTPTETVAFLRNYNVWRRGNLDDQPMPDPRELGEAIDAAIEMIDRLEAAEKAVNEAYQRGYETGQEEVEKERDTLRDALDQVFGSGLLSGSYTLHERMRNIVSNALSEKAQEVQKQLAAQPAPSVPREAIDKMLTQLMDIAVSNGANSISMPDEYVEVAAWLCGIPAQPAPSVPDGYKLVPIEPTRKMLDAGEDTFVSSLSGTPTSSPIAVYRAMLAAAPEAKP